VAKARVAAHFAAEAVAIHAGHEDVGDNGIDGRFFEHGQRLAAVAGLKDGKVVGFQHGPQHRQVDG
jgi:hypothetical protein